MQTQHTNQVRTFLGQLLRLVIESGAVTDHDFCTIATPGFLAKKLAPFPEQRANILHSACNLPIEMGAQITPSATENLLSTALLVYETNPDPTQFMVTRIRSAVLFPEWIPVLEEEDAWKIALISNWYAQNDANTQEIVVRMLAIAREHNVLGAEDVLSAITPMDLGQKLAENLVRDIAIAAMTDALAGQRFLAESIQALTPDHVLVKTFGSEFIVTRVFGAVAKKHGLVKEKVPTVSRSGFTPTPPVVAEAEPAPPPPPPASPIED